MTQKTTIKYGNIAYGARETFIPSSEDQISFSHIEQIGKNIVFPNYANPIELYSAALDGSAVLLPSNTENANTGFWSAQKSMVNQNFENDIVLTLTSSKLFSSNGLLFVFDEYNNIYPTSMHISWYNNSTLLSQKLFSPDKSRYFCENEVDNYNKIVVVFYSLNIKENRFKLRSIEYGSVVIFDSSMLRSVNVIQEMSPIGSELPVSVCDFQFFDKSGEGFNFRDRQFLDLYRGENLISRTFITDFKRKSKTDWTVKSEDYIGILENIAFLGGMYKDVLALDILRSIGEATNVMITVKSGDFDDIKLSGYIPYTSCREALKQVVFAMGGVVDTSNRDDIYIYKLSDEISQNVPKAKIMQGQSFDQKTILTAFKLHAHQYDPVEEEQVLYEASKSGTGDGIFVIFDEPIQQDLSISSGEIIENGTNYAIINARENCVLTGKKYAHSEFIKTKRNTEAFQPTENILSIKDATLVSLSNVDNLLEKCYNYYVNTLVTSMSVVERDADASLKIGDKITFDTEYLGQKSGTVLSQQFNLNGGSIVKKISVR